MALDIVRTLRLPESEFFPGTQRKTGIAIQHTVGGTAEASFHIWRRDQANGGVGCRVPSNELRFSCGP